MIGDILIHQPTKPKMHQKKISEASNSAYTHASVYLGDDMVLEANPPQVRTRNIKDTLGSEGIIGVLRSQAVFTPDRKKALQEFAGELLGNNAKYDILGALKYTRLRSRHINSLLDILSERADRENNDFNFDKRKYFCSALVVACYCVVGIIDKTAYPLYPPEIHAPGDLLHDPTFGWVLGYIDVHGIGLSKDDPLRYGTLWSEQDSKWWDATGHV
ncbi:hypothetical protein SAMN04488011_101839 [Palleronia pelagia]|uniref:Permuted papain-like amidase enzyme, YaeF/YiiX, C92 family n=2 Tax=Palleronia pelagia TaxID=387096 RepID=A0A1H8C2H2_9RHOB|nr:hypothetical protein SAMN04488011_101839 [Palleronia pelagia]